MFDPNDFVKMDTWDTVYLFLVLPLAYNQGGMAWLFLAGLFFFVQTVLRKVPLDLPPVIEGVFASKPEIPQLPASLSENVTPEVRTWARDAERSL